MDPDCNNNIVRYTEDSDFWGQVKFFCFEPYFIRCDNETVLSLN